MCSHQTELGLGEGNAKADAVVSPAFYTPMDSFSAARESHAMFHQSAKVLKQQFGLTWNDAQGIVRACSQCSQHGTGLGLGVNPRGLKACELWLSLIHISEPTRQAEISQPSGYSKRAHYLFLSL